MAVATVFRQLIQATLEGMEAGRFQEFCLQFLPRFAERFKGLERAGHTVSGKTRPGVPDLIRTLESGKQIAVECGTEERYWGPTKELKDLKPCEDISKCIEVLDDPVEIVAVGSREIPRGSENLKSRIVTALQARTQARITLVDVAEISDFLNRRIKDPQLRPLISDFFPDLTTTIEALEDQEKYKISEAVARHRSADVSAVLRLAEQAVTSRLPLDAARQFVLRKLAAVSRCIVAAPPEFSGIRRKSVESLPLANPGGKIRALVGLPKIGKSAILLQLRSKWETASTVRFFDIPPDDADQCVSEIATAVLKVFLPENDPRPLMNSRILRRAELSRATTPTRPVLIVVDNADNLPRPGLKQLSDIVLDLKEAGLVTAETLSCIFSSSKRLTEIAAVDELVEAPHWQAPELRQLLERHLGGVPGAGAQSDAYLNRLVAMSGGHPLFSLALAQKCASVEELIASSIRGISDLADEDFSKDAQAFLYNELLSDSDSQNFVQRLSVLIGKQGQKVLNGLRQIAPAIQTSVAVMLDRLRYSAVEGDEANGYAVPPLFREIAKQRIDHDERCEVLRKVASVLLEPDGNVINVDSAIWGIAHAVAGEDFSTAMSWAVFLIMNALREDSAQPYLETILSRLKVIGFLPRLGDFSGQFMQTRVQIALAMGFQRIGSFEQAAEVLARFYFEAAPPGREKELVEQKHVLRAASIVLWAFCLVAKPVESIAVLERLTADDLAHTQPETRQALLTLLGGLVSRCVYDGGTSSLVHRVIAVIDEGNSAERHEALLIASSVAVRAKTDRLAADDIDQAFGSSRFGQLLREFSRATLLLVSGQAKRSLPVIDSALQVASELAITAGPDLVELLLTRGDAAFNAGENEVAKAAYAKVVDVGLPDSFEVGWASWRSGVINQDEQSFLRSADIFGSSGLNEMWSRAVGARAALLIKHGRKSEGLECLASVADRYFSQKIEEVGPAAAVALSHVTRLEEELQGRRPTPEEEFPPFETDPYERVLAGAAPRGGATTAFFIVGEAHRLLGEQERADRFFLKALAADPLESDLFSIALIVERLIARRVSDEIPDKQLLKRCAELLIRQDRAGQFLSRSFLPWCLFHSIDGQFDKFGRTDWTPTVIEALQQALENVSMELPFWTAEISLRRALLAEKAGQETYTVVKRLKRAYSDAQKSGNSSVSVAAGHRLGFQYVSHVTSLREAAEFQFAVVRGIEIQNSDLERILTIAKNLYSVWRNSDYSRLSEYDLKAKKMLKDSADEMNRAKVPDDVAQGAMLLLLCRLYDHNGPAARYILSNSNISLDALPPDVQERLKPLVG